MTIAVGAIIALLVASAVSAFGRTAGIVTFVALFGFCVAIGVSFARRQDAARGGRLGLFADPQDWRPQSLPPEFRFITHATPIHQVQARIGAPSHRPPVPAGAIRYDWPDGRIIFVYAQPAERTVSAIQVYDELSDIPIDEII
jgi:hypothetical protein